MRDGRGVGELLEASGEPRIEAGKAYPYPTPRDAARARRIIELVDEFLKLEKDEERRKLLQRMRELAVQATHAYPAPPAGGEDTRAGLSAGTGGEVWRTLRAVARTLGRDEPLRGEIPDLGKRVQDIRKRIDVLAGVTGGEEDGKRVSFRGLL